MESHCWLPSLRVPRRLPLSMSWRAARSLRARLSDASRTCSTAITDSCLSASVLRAEIRLLSRACTRAGSVAAWASRTLSRRRHSAPTLARKRWAAMMKKRVRQPYDARKSKTIEENSMLRARHRWTPSARMKPSALPHDRRWQVTDDCRVTNLTSTFPLIVAYTCCIEQLGNN
jgi:hypothetical protein